MQDDGRDQRWLSGFALPVSLGLHLAVVAFLVLDLPRALQKPQEDGQAVNVDLVPPPEPAARPKAKPPAPAEKPPEKTPAPPPSGTTTPQTPARLSPAFHFGERDEGPRKALDGNSAEDAAQPSAQKAPDEQASPEKDASPAPDKDAVLSLPEAVVKPAAKPADARGAGKTPKLNKAKKLFSRSATGDALATTAMRDLPRGVRATTLCVTELREQLLNASPPYFADVLPSQPLREGTVIDAPGVAFRADGRWQELSYRCEVDADATKVMSFAFRIGEPIPRSEWKQRGFPSQ